MHASEKGHIAVVLALLDAGADAHAENEVSSEQQRNPVYNSAG
jgi:hypothetical protein